MNPVVEKLAAIGIVPVVKIDDAQKAVPLAKALANGGLPCAEVTFRTAAAAEAIGLIAKAMPDMMVGAGTVLTTLQVDKAVQAGAKFIVSPGFNPKVVAYCVEKGIPIVPGTSSASDIEAALEFGLDVVKFFPAEASGGLAAIKALAAPYVNVKFMPTGGIGPKNLKDYLAFPKILACGGSWMVDAAMIEAGDFEGITRLTREAVTLMLGFTIAHIGVNCEGAEEAEAVAKRFGLLLGLPVKAGNSSVFTGGLVEAMKAKGRGTNGHIAIGTTSVMRARNYMQGMGFTFNEESATKGPNGETKAIYINEEIGGFAIHLLQK